MQARVKAIAEIVAELVQGVKTGQDVDLNEVKRVVSNLPLEVGLPHVAVIRRKCLPLSAFLSSNHMTSCAQAAMKYELAKAPKLVEIIAAVPDEHRATLLPQYALTFKAVTCACC